MLIFLQQALHPVMKVAEKEGSNKRALAIKHNALARETLMNNIISYLWQVCIYYYLFE